MFISNETVGILLLLFVLLTCVVNYIKQYEKNTTPDKFKARFETKENPWIQ